MLDSSTPTLHIRQKRFLQLSSAIKTPVMMSFFLSFGMTFTFAIFYFLIQPEVPIFYSLAQPQDFLVRKEWLALFPVLSLAITFGHSFLLRLFSIEEKVIQQLFSWASTLVILLLAIAYIRIIFLVM